MGPRRAWIRCVRKEAAEGGARGAGWGLEWVVLGAVDLDSF